jgi:hypothetical protein
MRIRAILRVLFCLCWAFVFASAMRPQSADLGSLEGIVTDPSGGVVPGVALTAKDQHRSTTFVASTNRDGLYHFSILPVGTYDLAAEHPGFATWLQKGIEVTIGAQISINLTLRLAGESESVVVQDPGLTIETTRSQFSSTVDSSSVSSLPANGRNYLDFVLLTPGVTRGSRGFDLSFAGQRKMNLLCVDGADNDNTYFTEVLGQSGTGFAPYQFSMAAIQEFQVSTNSYSAELGRAAGGVINVVTKSGTNEFHGSAFWYYRDKSMNANDLVNKLNSFPKSPYHFNQFGGTLGGPLVKNKLFFFLNSDGQRSTAQNLVLLNLPAGFSLSPDPTVAVYQQRAIDYLQSRASPWLRTFHQDVAFERVDWRINPAHLLSARWNRQRFAGGNLENSGQQNSFEHTGASLSSTDTLALSLSSSLTSSLANSLLFAYVRSHEPGFANSSNPEANIFQAAQLVLTIGRNPMSPREQDIDRLQFSDTFSVLRGRHAIKFGAEALPNWIAAFSAINFSGSFRFPNLESFGRSLAAAPPALPDQRRYIQTFSGDGSHGIMGHPNFVDYAVFVQDEWRIHPRFTLNLGLRYDLQVIRKPIVRNPSAALAAAGLDTSRLRTDADNVAPRLGLAWAPLRSNRFVLRAGYGLFYARTPSIMTARSYSQNGITNQTATFSGGTSNAFLIPSYPNSLCGAPDPSGLPPNCPAPAVGDQILEFFAPAYRQPYTQQGSFGLETEFAKDWILSASYLIVKGTHLQRVRDVNLPTPETQATIGIANTSTVLAYSRFALPPRPIGGFDRILLMESAASSVYHALAVQVSRRFSHNFWISSAYTLSKTIDDNPEPIAVNPGPSDNLLLSDASNPGADRGPGVNDQRHRFVLSGIWLLPGRNLRSHAASTILGGWELSGIFTAQTGLPYSGLVNSDLNNDGNTNNDRTPGLGRNTFHLPVTVSLDPRVTKNVPLTEGFRVQLLAEAFNLLNHGNIIAVRTTQFAFSNVSSVCGIAGTPCLVPQNAGLNAFATPTATSGPKILQLALKFNF